MREGTKKKPLWNGNRTKEGVPKAKSEKSYTVTKRNFQKSVTHSASNNNFIDLDERRERQKRECEQIYQEDYGKIPRETSYLVKQVVNEFDLVFDFRTTQNSNNRSLGFLEQLEGEKKGKKREVKNNHRNVSRQIIKRQTVEKASNSALTSNPAIFTP
jgi:hypothetical protein